MSKLNQSIMFLIFKKGKFMLTGKVKWFNYQKGYGFISPDNGTKDIFVHISAIDKSGISSLNENDKVSYDEARNNGKISAANIKLLNN